MSTARRRTRARTFPRAGGVIDRFRPHRSTPRQLLSALGLAVLLTLLVTAAAVLGWLDFPEMQLLDWRFHARGPRPASAQVVVIGVDDAALNGRRFSPVPRDLLAQLVAGAAKAGAKTILLDVELRDRVGAAEDESLKAALLEAQNVVLISQLDQAARPALPPQEFRDLAAFVPGLAHVEKSEVDQVCRWERPVWWADGAPLPSMALAAYAHFTGQPMDPFLMAPSPLALARLLNRSVDGRGRLLIDWAGPTGSIPSFTASELVRGQVPAGALKDRLVLIGLNWSGNRDVHATPFGEMSGVELQANVLATLFEQRPLRMAGLRIDMVLLFLVVLAVSLSAIHFAPSAAFVLSLVVDGLWVQAGLWLFTDQRLFVRMAPPLLGILLAYLVAALVTERRANRLRGYFRRYVGRRVADELADLGDDQIGWKGRPQRITMLFSDIRDYTQQSRGLPPEQVVRFLNRYFERMTAVVLEHHAFLDKYIGDGIMALFGMILPDPSGTHGALDAARAALRMAAAAEQLRLVSPEFKDLSIGIGLHTGEVIIGDLGTPDRSDLTAVGSPVNLASRIEGETKRVFQERRQAGERPAAVILMSSETRNLLGDYVEARPIGDVRIRGLEDEEVTLWELTGLKPPPVA